MRILATFTGAFALGIFLAQYLLPASWLLPCGAAVFALAFGRLLLRNDMGRRLLLVCVGLSLAFGYDWLYIREVQRPLEALAGADREAVMTLCDYAVSTDYGAKVTVRLEGLSGKTLYYGNTELLDLEPGQTVTDLVYLQSAARIRDDDVTSFTSKGVFLLAYRRGEASFGEGTSGSPRWWPVRMGHAMQTRISELFDGDAAGFLTAILTGDKSELSVEGAAALSEAGLYHILAVSGMHCGFLLALVTYLTGRHRRRLKAACALPLLAFYAALTGGSPSVLRACVMLAFLLAAPLLRRDSDGPTALATALFLILLVNPFAAASISLQLSFAAMAGILWLTPRLYRLLMHSGKGNRLTRFLAAGFSATMGALVFTVPLSGGYFGTLTLIAPLSNLLCLWAASGVFLLGLLTVLTSFVCPPLAGLLTVFPGLLIRYILFAAGRAVLTILPPVGEGGDNEQGLSVLATSGNEDLLITGDMNAATERKLLETFVLPDIEVLVTGHHGSKYSTCNDLLDALTPETACISVGSNSYGHPADETLRRLAEHGCAVYRTDMQGNIHLSLN